MKQKLTDNQINETILKVKELQRKTRVAKTHLTVFAATLHSGHTKEHLEKELNKLVEEFYGITSEICECSSGAIVSHMPCSCND